MASASLLQFILKQRLQVRVRGQWLLPERCRCCGCDVRRSARSSCGRRGCSGERCCCRKRGRGAGLAGLASSFTDCAVAVLRTVVYQPRVDAVKHPTALSLHRPAQQTQQPQQQPQH